jgi:hypothetical protein
MKPVRVRLDMPPVQRIYAMDDHSQNPINDDHYYRDPEYPWDAYIQA